MNSKLVRFIVSFIVISVIMLTVGVLFFGDEMFRQGSSRYSVLLLGLFGSAVVSLSKSINKLTAFIIFILLTAYWIVIMPEETHMVSAVFSILYSAVFGISMFLYLFLPEKTKILRRTGFLLLGVSFSLLSAVLILVYFVLFLGSEYMVPALILYSSSAFIIGLGIGLGKLLSDYIIGSYTSAMEEIKKL